MNFSCNLEVFSHICNKICHVDNKRYQRKPVFSYNFMTCFGGHLVSIDYYTTYLEWVVHLQFVDMNVDIYYGTTGIDIQNIMPESDTLTSTPHMQYTWLASGHGLECVH